ncbi:hypothetical protein T265_15981, partial [Opisthorchis viverrini]
CHASIYPEDNSGAKTVISGAVSHPHSKVPQSQMKEVLNRIGERQPPNDRLLAVNGTVIPSTNVSTCKQ